MFTDEERSILSYNDGERSDAKADPMVVHTKLLRAAMDDGKDIDVLFKQVRDGQDATDNRALLAQESILQIVAYAHKAFGTQAMDKDGNGLTTEECLGNLNSLLELNADAKKNGDLTPPESPATDSLPADTATPESAVSATP